MDRTSILDPVAREGYQRRLAEAYFAWYNGGNEGIMPGVWQDMYECTLLDPEQLVRAMHHKALLLKYEQIGLAEKISVSCNDLQALERRIDRLNRAGGIYWCEECLNSHNQGELCPKLRT